jgi:hypothetical protein
MLEDIYVYRQSGRNRLYVGIDYLRKHVCIYKTDYSKKPYRITDSIVLSVAEQESIDKFFRSGRGRGRGHRWTNELSWNHNLISRHQAITVISANNIIDLNCGNGCRSVYQCSEPFFFRNQSLAVFYWKRMDSDSYETFSLYVKGKNGWEEFAPIYNGEGALRLD